MKIIIYINLKYIYYYAYSRFDLSKYSKRADEIFIFYNVKNFYIRNKM